jgi:hypothetical protein
MTPSQEARLTELERQMRAIARRSVSQNDFNRRMNQCDDLRQFLTVAHYGYAQADQPTAEEWLAIAEKAAEGHDQPGTIRMTMAQVLSGMPPEHKGEKA